MVRSVSTSYASFEAELEGAILHHTGAVDYYLETAAPKWSDPDADKHATPQHMHMMYVADMTSSFWQAMTYGKQGEISVFDDGPLSMAHAHRPPAGPPREAFNASQLLRHTKRRPRAVPLQHVGESRLEQYLQQDLQRYMEGMREQLDSEASGHEAAMLSTDVRHSRTSSSGGSGSFVRLPDADMLEDEDDNPAGAPLAPAAAAAAAAAAAMAAVNDLFPADVPTAVTFGMPSVAAAAAPMPATPAAEGVAAAEAAPAAGQRGDAAAEPAAVAAAAISETPAAAAAADIAAAGPAHAGMQGASPAAGAAAMEPGDTEASQQGATAPAAAAATAAGASVPPFTMERDEDIAAQKAAARMRLAELEEAAAAGAGGAAATSGKAATLTESSSVPAGKKAFDDTGSMYDSGAGTRAGSLHNSRIPSRPRGLAGMHAHSNIRLATNRGGYVEGDPLGYGPQAIMQQYRFFQILLLGLLCCMLTLPALWALQTYSTREGKPSMLVQLLTKLQAPASYLYLPSAAALLLYLFTSVIVLRPPLLHFSDATLEHRYLVWSNSGKLFLDSMFQTLLLVVCGCLWLRLKHGSTMGDDLALSYTRTLLAVVSMMGSGLPVVLLLLLRSPKYPEWREQLLAGSRVLSILAISVMQMTLPADCADQLPVSMPFVALAQLVGIACMQVRLASFVPCQVLHLFVLLWKTHASNSLLHFAQLFGGGLFLPCLLLYSMELYSRKAFVSTMIDSKKTV